MGTYVGADWASNGWVAAELDDDGLSVGFYPTIWNLWHERGTDAEQILVDIPIGLPEDGRRTCDHEAKDCLGNRGSSVFLTPIREAVYEDNVEDAKEVQTDAIGYSISNQAWAIVPRIREVDTFLQETEQARDTVREGHPEISFNKLNNHEDVGTKSDEEGIDTRKKVMCDKLGIEENECNQTVHTLTEPTYARRGAEDDVLDAIVLAVTARHVGEGNYSILPEESDGDKEHPPTDEKGIPMEIVYPDPEI